MTTINMFDGTGDVKKWAGMLTAKLIAKGYKNHLLDINRPNGADAAAIAAANTWDANRDKALGIIMMHMDLDIMGPYTGINSPEALLKAVVDHYKPHSDQEIDKLECEFKDLTYDEKDSPIVWVAKLRSLISKLTIVQAIPSDRAIKSAVWDALETAYGVRVEIMRASTPNMTLAEL